MRDGNGSRWRKDIEGRANRNDRKGRSLGWGVEEERIGMGNNERLWSEAAMRTGL